MITVLVLATLKATAILCACTAATFVLRRHSAALRHGIWTAGLAGALLVFALPGILPAWRVIPAPVALTTLNHDARPTDPRTTISIATTTSGARATTARNDATAFAGADTPLPPSAARIDWTSLLVALYLAGVAIVFARYAWGMWMLHRLAARAIDVDDVAWRTLARDVTARLRLRQSVRLVSSPDLAVPLTWGLVRAHVGVPADADDWTTARRQHVLHHELAHVKRRDALTQTIAHAATSLLWFHPLVWHASRRMRHERERACDDAVLRDGVVASDYANDLLAIASYIYRGHVRHSTALAMAHRSQVEGRLLALLDPTVKRGPMSLRTSGVIAVLAIAIVVPVSALTSTPRSHTIIVQDEVPMRPLPESAGTTATPPAMTIAPVHASSTPPAHTIAQPPQALSRVKDIFAGCTRSDSTSSSESSHSDGANHTWSATWHNGDCSFDMKANGLITFNHDATAINTIATGGFMDITTDIRGDITHVIARPGGSGLDYTFTHNGTAAAFSTDGAAWLAGFLQALDRQTGFAIDLRFPALMQEGGAGRVLDEMPSISMGYAKARYLERLIASTSLSPSEVHRTLDVIGTVGSDYETGELLGLVANRFGFFDIGAQAAYLRAVSTLSADHTIAEALSAFIPKASPTTAQTELILIQVQRMNADYEIARVLVQLADKKLINDDTREAYLRAVMRIRSSYERDRAMAAIAR